MAVTRSHGIFYTGLAGDSLHFAVHQRGKKTTVLRTEKSVEIRPVLDMDGDGVPEFARTADSPPACLAKLYPEFRECLGTP